MLPSTHECDSPIIHCSPSSSDRMYLDDTGAMKPKLSASLDRKSERQDEDSRHPNVGLLEQFLRDHSNVKYLRLQWVDYGSILRVKLFPVRHILSTLKEGKLPSVPGVVLSVLPVDRSLATPVDEYKLYPAFESLKLGPRAGYATAQCEFREHGEEVPTCPRTLLRKVVSRARNAGREFLIGFEVEVVFIKPIQMHDGKEVFSSNPADRGHAWNSSRALHDDQIMCLIEAIMEQLEASSITIEQFHSESAPGQYEFILAPLAPLEAVDTLIATRNIIQTVAARFSLRATLLPKPFPERVGTGCHVHISMTPSDRHDALLAGLLKHLRAITAFTYGNFTSYHRVKGTSWAGGTFVAWGSHNRETPLRRIQGSHFELRCMDGFANVYLAMSAILGVGIQGVLDAEPLIMPDCQKDPATLSDDEREEMGITESLPAKMEEALQSLREDATVARILGKPVVEHYLRFKEAEHEMLQTISSSERGALRNWLIQRY